MMRPSRNDPCPCGSGRKYKACHMRADEIAVRTEDALGEVEARTEAATWEAARRAAHWEADVAPLTDRFRESGGEPGSLAMVTAGGMVLYGDVRVRRAVGLQARAQAVLDAVMASARQAGVLPERLHLRDAALADALRPELAARGMTPVAGPVAELDEALESALEHMAGSRAHAAASVPWRWAETEASPAALADFHAATAAYYRAEPWLDLSSDTDVLLLTFPGEKGVWGASVMGMASIQTGLALYSDPQDLMEIVAGEGEAPDAFISVMQGYSLSMSYDPLHELPKPMRREVAAAGWEVAGADAYPTLMGIGVPGRRITSGMVARATMACRAVVAFLAADVDERSWRDPETGVTVTLFMGDDEGEPSLPWPPLAVSHPVGPAGPHADPQAALRMAWKEVGLAEQGRHDRFIRWAAENSPSRAAFVRLARAGRAWAQMLADRGVPAQSVTELDLRLFLYHELALLERLPKDVARHLTRSLARLFAYYAGHEGIEYPWAASVLEELHELAADMDDVRDALSEGAEALPLDLVLRALRPDAEVPGTVGGWAMVFGEAMVELREHLHRHWLAWHDEVVRGGITDPQDVHDVLVGRQRQWENTPNPRLHGRTPKQALLDAEREAADRLGQDDD